MDSERNFNGSADPMITADRSFIQIMGPDFGFWLFGSSDRGSQRKSHFLSFMCRCRAVENMTRNSNALKCEGSVTVDSDLVDFLSGSTDSAINFSGSANFHTPIHPPLLRRTLSATLTAPLSAIFSDNVFCPSNYKNMTVNF